GPDCCRGGAILRGRQAIAAMADVQSTTTHDDGAQPPSSLSSCPPATFSPSSAHLSPAMRQYQQFKSQYPDYVLFFRMGDFYEMFWDDAQLAARVLGVALTSRSKGGLEGADAI